MMGELALYVLVYVLGLFMALPYAVHWVYADYVRTNKRHSVIALLVCVVGAIVWPLMLAIVLLFFFLMAAGFIAWIMARPIISNRPWKAKHKCPTNIRT